MSFLKSLFHRHIWQNMKETFLREERERYGEKWGVPAYANFRYIAIEQKCFCCGKVRVVSKRTILL
jgi:hypothetical protein